MNIILLKGCFHICHVTGPRAVVLACALLYLSEAKLRVNTAIRDGQYDWPSMVHHYGELICSGYYFRIDMVQHYGVQIYLG